MAVLTGIENCFLGGGDGALGALFEHRNPQLFTADLQLGDSCGTVLVMIGIARKDVTAYMNACDLHILSSDQEGSPNSVKECLCCGVPVVATDVGNVHDLLDDVPGCGVADSFTPEELAELADKALRNVPAASELSGSIVRKELDMDSVAEKLYRIYNATCFATAGVALTGHPRGSV